MTRMPNEDKSDEKSTHMIDWRRMTASSRLSRGGPWL